MPAEPDDVIHRLAVGEQVAISEIVERAHTSDDVTTVLAAALFTGGDNEALMARAATLAATTRDRQLVAIATAHLDGNAERVHDLARDHLADQPDSVLAAWISSATNQATRTRMDRS